MIRYLTLLERARFGTCPICERKPGWPCVNIATGRPLSAEDAHDARVSAAPLRADMPMRPQDFVPSEHGEFGEHVVRHDAEGHTHWSASYANRPTCANRWTVLRVSDGVRMGCFATYETAAESARPSVSAAAEVA